VLCAYLKLRNIFESVAFKNISVLVKTSVGYIGISKSGTPSKSLLGQALWCSHIQLFSFGSAY
jgi:xanthine/uracil permease